MRAVHQVATERRGLHAERAATRSDELPGGPRANRVAPPGQRIARLARGGAIGAASLAARAGALGAPPAAISATGSAVSAIAQRLCDVLPARADRTGCASSARQFSSSRRKD